MSKDPSQNTSATLGKFTICQYESKSGYSYNVTWNVDDLYDDLHKKELMKAAQDALILQGAFPNQLDMVCVYVFAGIFYIAQCVFRVVSSDACSLGKILPRRAASPMHRMSNLRVLYLE